MKTTELADMHELFYKSYSMLRALLVFSILAVGTSAAIFSRFAALLLYLWFALFRPQEFLWFDITPWQPSLWIGALLVIPSLLTGKFPNLTHPISIGVVLFLVTAMIAQVNAFNPAMGWLWLDYLFRLFVVSLLAVTLISTKRRWVWTVAVIAGSFGFYSAKAGLASLLGGGVRFYDGLAGAFIDNNGYALGAAMILPLLVAAGQNLPRSSWITRWTARAFYVAVPLSAMLIVSTFSRAGLLALIAVSLVFILLQGRRLLVLSVVALALLVIVPFIPLPEGYLERARTIRTYDEIGEDSALARLHFWRVAVDMSEANPLGVGLRNFESAFDRYDFLNGTFGRQRAVHNSHLQVLAETGYLGALIYAGLFGFSLLTTWRIRRRALSSEAYPAESRRFFYTSANGLIASMVAFLVGGAFISLALNDLTWLTFALVAALDRLAKQEQAQVVGDTEHREDVTHADPSVTQPDPSLTQPAALGIGG
jgi:probable O-glycosylation ligase (exosortase A-associated)